MYNDACNLIKAEEVAEPTIGSLMDEHGKFRSLSPHSMIIEKAIEVYLDWKSTHAAMAPNRYKFRLKQFAAFLGRERTLKEITEDDIIRYHRALEKLEYQKGGKLRRYSRGTIAYSSRVLKNFFVFWNGRKETDINHKEIQEMRYVVPLKRVVTEKEFVHMDGLLDPRFLDDLRKKLTIHLLWDTGMRVSELCDMDIGHINDKHPVYGIRSATVRTRKTMRYDLVAWSKETDDLLSTYLGLRLCIDAKTDALFINSTSDNAKRVTTRTIQRWIDEIAKAANLGKGITPHSFRHGKGHSILSTPGSNLRDVSAILRHSKPESSYQYLNLNQDSYLAMASKYLIA